MKGLVFVALLGLVAFAIAKQDVDKKPKKKDPKDYTDADIYKLEEEWTVCRSTGLCFGKFNITVILISGRRRY